MGLVTIRSYLQDFVIEKYLEGFTETYDDWLARGKIGERKFEVTEYSKIDMVDKMVINLLINLSNLKEYEGTQRSKVTCKHHLS